MAGLYDAAAAKASENSITAKAEKELREALEAERPDELGAMDAEKDKNTEVKTPKAPEGDDVPEVIDGVNWKQRYSNLQRYIDKTLKPKFQGEIDTLKEQVSKLTETVQTQQKTSAPAELPTSKEEVEALKRENPAAYSAILGIAKDVAETLVAERMKQLEGTVSELNKRQKQTAEEAAFVALQKRHKDLDLVELFGSDEFQEWVGGKSKRMQEALQGFDVDAADEVLQLYKYEHGLTGKKSTPKDTGSSDAVRAVKSKSKPEIANDAGGFLFTESQIEEMSAKEFEKNFEAIEKATREGRVLPDRTDPARAARLAAQAA